MQVAPSSTSSALAGILAAQQRLDEDAERYLSAQEYELVACMRTVMSPEDDL